MTSESFDSSCEGLPKHNLKNHPDAYQADRHAKVFGYVPDFSKNYFIRKQIQAIYIKMKAASNKEDNHAILNKLYMKIYTNNKYKLKACPKKAYEILLAK